MPTMNETTEEKRKEVEEKKAIPNEPTKIVGAKERKGTE
jgi:hypothetical protein